MVNSPPTLVGIIVWAAFLTKLSVLSLYFTSAATVQIPIPCFFANFSREGILAMVPSSSMISQITPAGFIPARRARSTDPSVCPILTMTPPSLARKGKIWPGLAISLGVVSSATAVRMVVALSAAEIPVVTPFLASMDTVNPVPYCEVLLSTIIGKSKRSAILESRERQISPLPYLAMKFMASGVTASAAMVRSPSFSRSSSSTRITILPFLISSIACSIVKCGIFKSFGL